MTENRVWLIRHQNNSFSRPISEAELKQMFSSGEMKPQDEICHSTGYWFSLQDVKEMRKHFGNIAMDGIFKKVKEEVTQERYVNTAPLVVPTAAKPLKYSTPPKPVEPDDSIRKASPLMKAMLIGLTLLVIIFLFVYFG